jgi:hypothetical protein
LPASRITSAFGCLRDRPANGGTAIDLALGVRHAGNDGIDNGLRLFAARVVAGDHDTVGQTLGYRPICGRLPGRDHRRSRRRPPGGPPRRCHGAQRKQAFSSASGVWA